MFSPIFCTTPDCMGGQIVRGTEALAEWLAKYGLKRSELAELLEVHKVTVTQWLNGAQRPHLVDRMAIQRLAGIPLDWWLTDHEAEILHSKLARVTRLRKTKPISDDIFTRLAGRIGIAS